MCKKNIASTWAQRLLYESSMYDGDNTFLTLTYEDSHCDNKLHKKHFVDFIKRLRKHLEPKKIKYFGCGEYGETFMRPHYHIIVFGYLPKKIYVHHYDKGKPIYSSPEIDKLWKYGFNQVGSVEKGSIYYVTGYVLKSNGDLGFRKMSNGLGLAYAQKNRDVLIQRYLEGHALPRYLLDKLGVPYLVKSTMQEKNYEELGEDRRIKSGAHKTKADLIKDKRKYRNQLIEAKDLMKENDLF